MENHFHLRPVRFANPTDTFIPIPDAMAFHSKIILGMVDVWRQDRYMEQPAVLKDRGIF